MAIRKLTDAEAAIANPFPVQMNVHAFAPRGDQAPSGYKVLAKGSDKAEIYLYGSIGASFWGDGITAKKFADDLKALGKRAQIDLRINSEGGDVFDGKAMYALLVANPAKIVVHIDGLAASAASFIAMAGAEIKISEGAFVMIHNAWTMAMGGAEDMRQMADLLESVSGTIRDVYVARTQQSAKKIQDMMDAETWLTGPEALKLGFADSMVENLKVAASVRDPSKFRHVPQSLLPNRTAVAAMNADFRSRYPAPVKNG